MQEVLNVLSATDFEVGIFIQPAFVYGLRYFFRDELSIIFHMMWPNRLIHSWSKQLRSHYTARTIKIKCLLVDHEVFCILVPFSRDIVKRTNHFFIPATEVFFFFEKNLEHGQTVGWLFYTDTDAIGMTRFGISTPKTYKLTCLYLTFWPEIGCNYSASSFDLVINKSFCFLESRESPEFFHIRLKARKSGWL